MNKYMSSAMTAAALGAVAMLTGCDTFPAGDPRVPVALVAHRGESADAPENTLPAFELAWRRGAADAIECDVHLTRDLELIVTHDDNAKRVTGVNRRLDTLTFEEARKLDAGRWKGEAFAGTPMPSLLEVMKTVPASGRIFVEIKGAKNGDYTVPFEAARVASGLRPDQVVIISFHESYLRLAAEKLPQYPRYWLLRLDPEKMPAEKLIARLRRMRADGADLGNAAALTPAYVKALRDAGFDTCVWTVDRLDLARHAAACGVSAITTNRTAALAAEWTADTAR